MKYQHTTPPPSVTFLSLVLLWVAVHPAICFLSLSSSPQIANQYKYHDTVSSTRWHMANPLNSHHFQTPASSTSDNMQVDTKLRKRWRRRRKDSTVVAINNEEDEINTEIMKKMDIITKDEQQSTISSTAKCPIFSMTFPRYTIDLSGVPKDESEHRRIRRVQNGIITKLVKPNSNDKSTSNRKEQDYVNPLGLMSDLFKGVTNALPKNDNMMARKAMESLYSADNFRWASSSSSSSAKDADQDLHAAVAFWRLASDITSTQPIEQQQNNIWYLALPETTTAVAQNLCDILNWYTEYAISEKDSRVSGVILQAEIDTQSSDTSIPVIRFIVTVNSKAANNNMQQQEDIERQRQLLPTVEDTEKRTKAWVTRLLVKLRICPFTKSEKRAGQGLQDLGVPVADIMYCSSNAISGNTNDVFILMADIWEAISDMIAARPSGVSSILLSAPGYDDNFKLWAGPIFAMLETCVSAVQAEEMVGVVCFHPSYVTPDGKSWPGFGHMHSVPRLKKWYNEHFKPSSEQSEPSSLTDNEIAAGGAWQRRTPHAVINVLRAEQLEAAEGRRSTGELYERNIRVLVGKEESSVGLDKLTKDLQQEQNL